MAFFYYSPGDHIKANRVAYDHHGIYLGEGEVIHYTGEIFDSSNARVQIDKINTFSDNSSVERVFHEPDKMYIPEAIVIRACYRLCEKEYSVFFNNCEHFCNWCVEGVSKSDQLNTFFASFSPALEWAIQRFVENPSLGPEKLQELIKSNPVVAQAYQKLRDRGQSLEYVTKPMANSQSDLKLNLTRIIGELILVIGEIGKGKKTPTYIFDKVDNLKTYIKSSSIFKSQKWLRNLVGPMAGLMIFDFFSRKAAIARKQAKLAHDYYLKVNRECEEAIKQIELCKKEFEATFNKHFNEVSDNISFCLNKMQLAVENYEIDDYAVAINNLASIFGHSLRFKTLDEFNDFMASDEHFVL
ncbi:MAG: lecithin retinol acyltransferase family protein [Deltaproteobacteria bacterium]|jgi:hypothetical protein|nr:lecithin retinol acyltransferase family protein [Deltaproteobacteria bacterium]